MPPNCRADSLSLSFEVCIKRAKYHSCMVFGSLMEAGEVSTIVRQENSALSHGKCENLDIRHGSIRVSGVQ